MAVKQQIKQKNKKYVLVSNNFFTIILDVNQIGVHSQQVASQEDGMKTGKVKPVILDTSIKQDTLERQYHEKY